MKKVIGVVLCCVSVSVFAGERSVPSSINARQEASLALKNSHAVVAQNFIAGTTVRSALKSAQAHRATIIAKRAATTRTA